MLFDGIDGINHGVVTMFDLHVPDSAPTHYDDLGELDLDYSTSFRRYPASAVAYQWLTTKGTRSPVDSTHLRMSQLKCIHALRTVSGEGGSSYRFG
jgi:hypothetical protein